MEKDPLYLRHLGEFATLKNVLGGCYYQTVWEDFSSDEEVWNEYARRTGRQTLRRLVEQIDILLQRPAATIGHFLADAIGACGGLSFENPQEATAWLNRFRSCMVLALAQKQ